MSRRFNTLSFLFLTVNILFTSCKDNEDINFETVTEHSQYVIYQDGVMLSTLFQAWPTPAYALNVPAEGATFRIDDVVNFMTDLEIDILNAESNDYITVEPYYVDVNGMKRIDYFDITFKLNETGKQREANIRTLPFEAYDNGDGLIFVGTCFWTCQKSK